MYYRSKYYKLANTEGKKKVLTRFVFTMTRKAGVLVYVLGDSPKSACLPECS